jgi:hypothetical protein
MLAIIKNLSSSHLLSKNLKSEIYRTIILPAVLYGCEIWSFTLREEHRLRMYEDVWGSGGITPCILNPVTRWR